MARKKYDASVKDIIDAHAADWAPLTDDGAAKLPDVLARIDARLKAEASGTDADKLRAATTILMGLRHPPDLINRALKGATAMWDKVFEDSSIVQQFMKQGEKQGRLLQARKQLLRVGQAKFGRPKPAVAAAIKAIDDLDRLDTLAIRLLTVDSWKKLLAR